MKRTFYIFLMMIFFVLISFFIYFSVLVILTRNGMIPDLYIDWFLGIMMSLHFYMGVGCIGGIIGYFFGKKWWKIIYIDGVYYFDTSKKRDSRRRTIKKNPKDE